MFLMSWIPYKQNMGNPVFLLHFSPITEGCSRYDSWVVVPGDLVSYKLHLWCLSALQSSFPELQNGMNMHSISHCFVPTNPFCFSYAKHPPAWCKALYCWLQTIDSETIMLPHPHLPVLPHCAQDKTSCKHLTQTIKQHICIFNSEGNWVKEASMPENS